MPPALRPMARSLPLALPLMLLAAAAQAHTGAGHAGGFVSGFSHPILGWDHVVAMVAVGLWGAVLGKPAIWILPVVFPLVMAFGAALGILGVPLPAVETGIALSGVVLGLAVALAVRAPLPIAAGSSASSPSSTATPMAPNCRQRPVHWPMAWASSWAPGCCTWPASPWAC